MLGVVYHPLKKWSYEKSWPLSDYLLKPLVKLALKGTYWQTML